MKKEAREQARELRRAGHSVKEICRTLGVAKSSVSVWVRDIALTEEQRLALKRHYPGYPGQHAGSRAVAAKYRELRRQYQEEGRAKSRNTLTFINSDADMLSFFVKFIRRSLRVQDEDFAISVICYTGNGLTVEAIEDYWQNLLELPRSTLRKTIVNVQPKSSQQKGRKLKYGLCKIVVTRSTNLVQHIYGAIQEYAGIEKLEWLM